MLFIYFLLFFTEILFSTSIKKIYKIPLRAECYGDVHLSFTFSFLTINKELLENIVNYTYSYTFDIEHKLSRKSIIVGNFTKSGEREKIPFQYFDCAAEINNTDSNSVIVTDFEHYEKFGNFKIRNTVEKNCDVLEAYKYMVEEYNLIPENVEIVSNDGCRHFNCDEGYTKFYYESNNSDSEIISICIQNEEKIPPLTESVSTSSENDAGSTSKTKDSRSFITRSG